MCWVSWNVLAKPKVLGGLGFREVQDFNDALLAKLSWRLLTNPKSLLSRILFGKYCKDSPFIHCKMQNQCSHGWRSIVAGRDVLSSHLESDILSLRQSLLGAEDSYAWLGTHSGEYTTKSGYFALAEPREKDRNLPIQLSLSWIQDLWMQNISPKIKVFLWKVLHKALPLGKKLASKAVTLPPVGVSKTPLFPWVIWAIWYARNLKILQGRIITGTEALTKAIRDASEWEAAQGSDIKIPRSVTIPRRSGSRDFTLKSDAAWSKEKNLAGIGWELQNSESVSIAQGSDFVKFVRFPTLAEAIGVFTGLREARARGIEKLRVC